MTVAELIALLQDCPQDQPVLVAYTPQGCPDGPDCYGSEARVGSNHAAFSATEAAWELDMPEWAMPVTVIYALDS